MPPVLSSTTTQATCAFIVNMKCQLQRTRLKIKEFICLQTHCIQPFATVSTISPSSVVTLNVTFGPFQSSQTKLSLVLAPCVENKVQQKYYCYHFIDDREDGLWNRISLKDSCAVMGSKQELRIYIMEVCNEFITINQGRHYFSYCSQPEL